MIPHDTFKHQAFEAPKCYARNEWKLKHVHMHINEPLFMSEKHCSFITPMDIVFSKQSLDKNQSDHWFSIRFYIRQKLDYAKV